MEFEEALKLVGEFGPFQWLLIAYLGFFMVPMHSITMAVHVFTLLEPPHWCRQPELEEAFNLTPEQARELGVPRDSDGKWSSCTMYDVNLTALGSWTPGWYFNESLPSRSNLPVVPCRSGWHYDYSLVYPTIVSQLDWVCGENWKAYISHTVFFGAMSFGVVLFGAFSDIFGRVPVTVLVYMLAGLGAAATFFTENFYVFLATRVLVGGVLLAIYTNPFVLVLEYMPPKKRMLMGGVFGFVYPLLGAALPWVAYAIGHWRLLNAVILVPALMGTIVSMFIPESTRWLLSKGKTDKAKKIMLTIGKINGRDVESKAIDSLQSPEKSDSATSSALVIFKYPCLRRSFVIMVLISGPAVRSATATDDPFVMSSATNAVDVLGDNAVPMADKFGRKTTASSSTLRPRLFVLPGFGPSQIDPTEVRTQALSIRQAFGSLGRIIGSHVVQLAVYGRFVPLFILGGLSCVAALITLPLPETNNRKLPETFEEAEAMHHQPKKEDKDEEKTATKSTQDKLNNN
ncbi:hypothetical protein MTO96_052212 [Rhipicephalus appendiculatus]